jgi:nucleoside-diphosphate-sugar epimerase
VICHLAWATGLERERSDVAAAMLRLTENLLKASNETGAGRFVFISSVSVYGSQNKEVWGPIKENAPLSGSGLYARSKIEAERLVRRFSADYGLSFIVLRASLVYGPGVPYIERFVNQVLTHPFLSLYRNDKDRIQLIHLQDVAEAVVLSAMKLKGNINGTFNVAGTEVLSQAELAEVVNGFVLRLSNLRRSTLPMGSRFHSACELKYDISKVREILGFVPRMNLQEGFSEIVLARRPGG